MKKKKWWEVKWGTPNQDMSVCLKAWLAQLLRTHWWGQNMAPAHQLAIQELPYIGAKICQLSMEVKIKKSIKDYQWVGEGKKDINIISGVTEVSPLTCT